MKKTLIVSLLLALAAGSLAISFRLEPEIRKCVKEEVHKDVLVVGEYRLSDNAGQRTDLVVRSPLTAGDCAVEMGFQKREQSFSLNNAHLQVADSKGHTLFRKESATKGRFAFTTEDYDMFDVCFYSVVAG